MSKRKYEADVEDDVVKKHSLDSDEEDEEKAAKKYEIMDEDDIEGQEEATIEFDGDIKITPFNMREELEEGHFDKDGNYFLNKDEDEIRDSWLDNIEWHKIKATENKMKAKEESDESESEADVKASSADIFRKIVSYMNPSETILQTIKRLGKKSSTKANASSRWNIKKKKNTKTTTESDKTTSEVNETGEEEDKRRMLEVTELADRLLHRGWMEIYQETYEKLNHRIRLQESGRLDLSKATNEDDSLDMFGEKFDATKADEPKASGSKDDGAMASAPVEWEFKWENKDEAKVYGPHSSCEMQQWVDDGYFSDGVWVRRVDQPEAQFHTSKRVDFDLYI